ncbi:hypothetical protein EE612_044319 [Oryza sativa]|nr:hypothetical protein EE612_044319 [Oryza sativa]
MPLTLRSLFMKPGRSRSLSSPRPSTTRSAFRAISLCTPAGARSEMRMRGRSAPAALASPRNRGFPLLMPNNAATQSSSSSERWVSSERMAETVATAPVSISAARPSAHLARLQTTMSASRRMGMGSAVVESDAMESRFLAAAGARASLD